MISSFKEHIENTVRVIDLISRAHPGVHVNLFSSRWRFQAPWVCDVCCVVNLYKETSVCPQSPIITLFSPPSFWSLFFQSYCSLWFHCGCQGSPGGRKVNVRFLCLERDLSSPRAIKIRTNWLERRFGLCGEAVSEVTLGQPKMRKAEGGDLPQLQGGEEGVRRVNRIQHTSPKQKHTRRTHIYWGALLQSTWIMSTWYNCQLCKAHPHMRNKQTWERRNRWGDQWWTQSVCCSGGGRGQKSPEITPAGSDLRLQAAEYSENQRGRKQLGFFSPTVATLYVSIWLITMLLGHEFWKETLLLSFPPELLNRLAEDGCGWVTTGNMN